LRNRLESWLFSVGIHGLLLLGATLAAIEFSVLAAREQPDFECAFRGEGPNIDQLVFIPEAREGRRVVPEPWDPFDTSELPVDGIGEPVDIVYYDIDKPLYVCGFTPPERRIVFVGVKTDRRTATWTYQDRMRSLENSRNSARRWKLSGARRKAHLLGLEVVCQCPSLPD